MRGRFLSVEICSEGVGLIPKGAVLKPDGFGKLYQEGTDVYRGQPIHPLTIGMPRESYERVIQYGMDTRWQLLSESPRFILLKNIRDGEIILKAID